jgi:hypothetical protein
LRINYHTVAEESFQKAISALAACRTHFDALDFKGFLEPVNKPITDLSRVGLCLFGLKVEESERLHRLQLDEMSLHVSAVLW